MHSMTMTTADRFAGLISQINAHVDVFNRVLAPEHQLKRISPDDPETYSDSMGLPWGEQRWPSKDNAGVYVICGSHEQDPTRLAAYVGKASLKNIGNRLWSHLTQYRPTGVYRLGGPTSGFIVEALLAIPIHTPTPRSMSSALEEHIITGRLVDVSLINTVGNGA